MNYRFVVQGSAVEPYVVIISREGNNLTASCDCPAGNKKQYCKHRFELFKGSSKGLVGGDLDKVSEIPELLNGTDVEAEIMALNILEGELAEVKKKVSAAKKAVAKAMHS
ncbi:MAG: hypothetical protein KUG74_06055 [Rhodobacteraceae bacterium]|nr:hypothetical protein [Paracoccaceae bacterium]